MFVKRRGVAGRGGAWRGKPPVASHGARPTARPGPARCNPLACRWPLGRTGRDRRGREGTGGCLFIRLKIVVSS